MVLHSKLPKCHISWDLKTEEVNSLEICKTNSSSMNEARDSLLNLGLSCNESIRIGQSDHSYQTGLDYWCSD